MRLLTTAWLTNDMYEVAYSRDMLVFRHYGEFHGAEFNRAMLRVVTELNGEQLDALKYIIVDCRAVTSTNLHDSDVAAFVVFQRKLAEIIASKGSDLAGILERCRMAFIDSAIPEVSKLQEERRWRQGSKISINIMMPAFSSLEEAQAHLGLQVLNMEEFEYDFFET